MRLAMFRERLALRICRILGVVEVAEPLTARVDHRDISLGNSGDDELVVDPDADHRESRHEWTVTQLADVWYNGARWGSRGVVPVDELARRNPYRDGDRASDVTLGLREASCGCCVIVDAVALNLLRGGAA